MYCINYFVYVIHMEETKEIKKNVTDRQCDTCGTSVLKDVTVQCDLCDKHLSNPKSLHLLKGPDNLYYISCQDCYLDSIIECDKLCIECKYMFNNVK